ncbi:MAG TPA: 2-succinyl-5-enolpyruvyl-6-hydroxy-3-cyclohexene-1-carboxylic-acid synthase [Mycobacteriales bacterium]|nr:2-succinyl-5-enolpyruvyl-6-hydroxy-3-cyclohexene-1-carboxylic-acid synthase [Mycobacteriales bacterium]
MNPSTALARVVVDELVRAGVREAVLAPGSRSAPLAFALHAADAAGRLRLHVRIDERSAAFLALGLGKVSRTPVAVVTTSGTAVANLHPAVLEASYAGVPMLLLTADRPPELRGVGANQTIDQLGLYGAAVRLFVELGAPDRRAGQNAYWRSAVSRAVAAATGARPGPVHVNVALREPLVPDAAADWPESLDGRPGGAPWTAVLPPDRPAPPVDDLPDRTVVVLGDGADAVAVLDLATARGWPVVAEPSSGAGPAPAVLPGGELLLRDAEFLAGHRPERVLVAGRPTLSRTVARLTASAALDVVAGTAGWTDPGAHAVRVLPGVPAPAGGRDERWLPAWREAADAARTAADKVLAGLDGLPEPVVAAVLMDAVPAGGLVVSGSSKSVRDLFLAGPRAGVTVLANRGVAGIDGTVSTAVGAALAAGGPTYALMGDLTFLHDANGLVIGPGEPRPRLTIVVVNNDGGGLFGLLEQGGPEHRDAFERVFGTPHGVDLAALCAATGTPHRRVGTREELAAALAEPDALRVVEVRTDRRQAAEIDRAL